MAAIYPRRIIVPLLGALVLLSAAVSDNKCSWVVHMRHTYGAFSHMLKMRRAVVRNCCQISMDIVRRGDSYTEC